MKRILLSAVLGPLLVVAATFANPAVASDAAGARHIPTAMSFTQLVDRLDVAVAANEMGVVSRASASMGAAARGVPLAGNMVVGVFRNDFAVRMLAASVEAGIEAPLRFYLTENTDGTATLTYRLPSQVFAPYKSADLDKMAAELDALFARIADQATKKH